MLRSRIIPCLLVHNKGLVKTINFKDPKYVGDPINAVKIFNEKEVDELIVLDIDATIEQLFLEESAEAIVGVSLSEASHPNFLVGLNGGFLNFISKDQKSSVVRRQDLKDLYFYEGSLYISEVDKYLEKEFYHEKTLGYIVPKWKSMEIDDIYDCIMVESIMLYEGYK